MFTEQRLNRLRLQFVVFLVAMRNLGEPFPPEHAGNERVFGGKPERDVDAALLDLVGIIATGLESPRLRRGAGAGAVADLDKEELFPVLLRIFRELGAALLPGG